MIQVFELIKALKNADDLAFVTMITPYGHPTYVESLEAGPNSVTLVGRTPYESDIDELVLHFGEEHRDLIVSAMEFIEKMETMHPDIEPFNYRRYIADILSHIATSEAKHVIAKYW